MDDSKYTADVFVREDTDSIHKWAYSRSIKYVVPQETVLLPLFFLIYIYSKFKQTFQIKIMRFADDTAIIYTSGTCENLKTVDKSVIKQEFSEELII